MKLNSNNLTNEEILTIYKSCISSRDDIWISRCKKGQVIGYWSNDNGWVVLQKGQDLLFNKDGTPSAWLIEKYKI